MEDLANRVRIAARFSWVYLIVGVCLVTLHIDLKCLFIPDITLESLETKDKPEPSPMTGFEHILNDVVYSLYSLCSSWKI